MRTERHDVVIVGGGAAGCVVASRLTEEPGRSVLLLEAGPAFSAGGDYPPALRDERTLPQDPLWRYEGIHCPGAAAASIVRGRVLGGSGAVNAAVYQRGLPEDYDRWGLAEWRAAALEPWFRRIEGGDARPGADGRLPLKRSAPAEWSAAHRAVHAAASALGAPANPDLLHAANQGVGPYARNALAGTRVNAALAYLAPALGRPGLTIRGGALVTRVILAGRRAVGVELARADGRLERIDAGEVILAAGAVETPQLLALSGIGPADALTRLGIQPRVDRPGVGAGLSDHPSVVLSAPLREGQAWDLRCLVGEVRTSAWAARRGERSDVQLMVMSGPDAGGDVRRPASPRNSAAAELVLTPVLYAPLSTGRVELRGAPGLRPRLHFGYLADAADRTRLREAVRHGVALFGDPEVAAVTGAGAGLPEAGTLADDDQLDAWIGGALRSTYHGCGTCRIGRPDDRLAVVDEHCRVLGVDALRIADLSVVPRTPSAPTHATALLVGERVAGWL